MSGYALGAHLLRAFGKCLHSQSLIPDTVSRPQSQTTESGTSGDEERWLHTRFSDVVRAWREHRRLRPIDLARLSGIDKGYLSRLEHGRVESPGDRKLVDLARAFGVPLMTLVTREMPPSKMQAERL
jgi:ribosome-binding protein aMBF1 (putative translation factor)